MPYDIICIGSATRDVFVSSRAFKVGPDTRFEIGKGLCLPFGSKMEVDKIVFASGGGGTNAAVTFARQGFSTACIGVVSQDGNGTDILDELRREGVDAKYFQMHTDDITAYSVILVGPDGERSILSYKGEGSHFDAEHIPFGILKSKWLYVDSLGGHFEVLERALDWARHEGVRVAINPGGKELAQGMEVLRPQLSKCDIVAMNQEEAAALTRVPFRDTTEIFRAMDEVVDGIFIMTRGQEGVLVSDGKKLYAAKIPNRDMVERTGAGDAFNSGFVAEYMRSHNVTKAIRFATANASSVVMFYGAKAGILRTGDTGRWPLVQVDTQPL